MTDSRRPRFLHHPAFRAAMAVLSVWCMAPGGCGGGSSGANNSNPNAITPAAPVADTSPNLTESDVNTIVLQAINEATARGRPATIAVVDRVGNVLAVTQMAGAPVLATVTSGRGVTTGLETVQVPTTLAALAKAYTGAYLSSNGNAFSTRTANQIVQEHFNPGVRGTPGGPLFGVQFSQLACSDFNTAASPVAGGTNAGPHRSPLGFSADSGGLPIYKNGVLAGGIGVMTKTIYGANLNIFAVPIDDDEVVAIAGTTGYAAPPAITADNIAVGGLTLQYIDASSANLAAPVSAAGTFTPLPVAGYWAGPAAGHTANAGLIYGSADGASGVAPDGALGPVIYPGTTQTSYVFTDGAGHILYQPTAGAMPADGNAITAAEAKGLTTAALNVAYSARAAIRVPTNSFAQVTVTVVDLDGNVLAQARTPDAPIFGADVSRQKARSAVFFSRPDAAAKINAITAPASTVTGTFADYITRSQLLIGSGTFSNSLAWAAVSIGDVARPFYPDGIDGNQPGSLSLPFDRWSVFSTGLQVDLVTSDIVAGTTGALAPATGCGNANGRGLPPTASGKTQLANGLQIFSGSVPIYRGNVLVGAVGVSGDGIQQDSLISFLGLDRFAAQDGANPIANAPAAIRVDLLKPAGVNLRYTNCPAAPFVDSTVQNPC
ncbi:MAG TPA: heme-binding protein [Stellaceae bacterium]|nr:heme-binding protein [Stellaceae bacterium]